MREVCFDYFLVYMKSKRKSEKSRGAFRTQSNI